MASFCQRSVKWIRTSSIRAALSCGMCRLLGLRINTPKTRALTAAYRLPFSRLETPAVARGLRFLIVSARVVKLRPAPCTRRYRHRKQLPDRIVCSSTLRAAYSGGALQQNDYRSAIEAAGPVHPHRAGQSKLPVLSLCRRAHEAAETR